MQQHKNRYLGMLGLLLLIRLKDENPQGANDGGPLLPLLVLPVRELKFFSLVFLIDPYLDPKVNYLQLAKKLFLLLILLAHLAK